MKCRDIEPLIYLHRKGERTAEEDKLVQEHLASCEACRELTGSIHVMETKLQVAFNHYASNKRAMARPYDRIYKIVPRPLSLVPAIRAVAAAILLIMATAFLAGELDYYRGRRNLEARIEKSAVPGSYPDCIRQIEKKIKSRNFALFARTDTAKINLIDEKVLAQYVQEQCGNNPENIKMLKKILIQAGMISPDNSHEKNN